eukprot:COSAG02_NODE_6052_length_3841_cov_1.903795_4_plen_92_part_00
MVFVPSILGQKEYSDQLGETGTRENRKEVEKRFVHYCYVCDKFVKLVQIARQSPPDCRRHSFLNSGTRRCLDAYSETATKVHGSSDDYSPP